LDAVSEQPPDDAAGPVPQPRSSRFTQQRLPSHHDHSAPLAYSDYRLERLIGAGRVGKVYRARHIPLDRLVAVKHLRKAFLKRADVVERFVTEARLVARLRHPGIVQMHGLGRTPAGGYFFAMDLVDGPDLARVLRSGLPPLADAVRWIAEACTAIEHAHEHGIVHCDLKPGNLLIDSRGRVRVADFGLARSMTEPDANQGRIEGTAPFMAPEQVSSCWGPITPRTDVYGLGAVLYTLLAGRPPWEGARLADVVAQVVSATPAPSLMTIVPQAPSHIAAACERALSKSPAERFESPRQFAAMLAGTAG
jgi:serine/threonine protein kinase